jgi:hypothetical protein
MNSKYQPLNRTWKENYAASVGSGATSNDTDDEDIALTQELETYKSIDVRRPQRVPNSKWLWVLHTILFASSLTLFTLSVMVRSSTLRHVREFSAWCMLHA